MLLNMRGGWAGDPGDQRMPSALELWIFPDELDPIYAESLGLMADQIARSRLVIRKNEERLERPSAVHQVFAIDEVELHSDLRQKRPALFETTGSNPLHRGPRRGTLFLAWSTLARVIVPAFRVRVQISYLAGPRRVVGAASYGLSAPLQWNDRTFRDTNLVVHLLHCPRWWR